MGEDMKTVVYTLTYDFRIVDWSILWENKEKLLLGRGREISEVNLIDRAVTFTTYEAAAARAVQDLSRKNSGHTHRMAELMREMTERLTEPTQTEEQPK